MNKIFIEIGAHDGKDLFHLLDLGWDGVMIEPIKEYRDKIKKHKNLTILDCAITDSNEATQMMLAVLPEAAETWNDSDYSGMSTLVTNASHFKNWPKEFLELREVDTLTPNNLFYNVLKDTSTIDLLKVDAEGYDLKILKSINYENYDIKFIIAEHSHCDENEMIRFLQDVGYSIISNTNENIYALKN